MTWVRIDDGFADHPKILAAGPLAIVAQIRALCYCARYLTDGNLPEAAAATILADLDISAEVLVQANLWHRNGIGYVIHDYLGYNPTRSSVMKLRAKRRKAGREGGQASAQARAEAKASAQCNQIATPSRPRPIETNLGVSTSDQGSNERQAKKDAALKFLRSAGLNPPPEEP